MALQDIKSLTPEVRNALATVLNDLGEMARKNPITIERVVELFERDHRVRLLTDNVLSLLPAEFDIEQWLAWIAGGPPPMFRPILSDPDQGRKVSARGAHHSAADRLSGATRKVEDLKARLSDAEAELAKRKMEMREAAHQLRAVLVFRMITEAGDLFSAPFALGPMWTVARAISGYLRRDIAFEAGLSSEERATLEEHIASRKKGTARILELLDFYCGDPSLEVKIHNAMLDILEEHHSPVQTELDRRNIDRTPLSPLAKRVHRRAEERRSSIRRGAPISDRNEVLAGLSARTPEEPDIG